MIANWPEGVGLETHASLPSTMIAARDRAQAGERGPLWIHARKQTAGTGRRGRRWQDIPGNFSATLLMTPSDPQTAALRSFVAALALRDTFIEQTGRADLLTLKWPNDVLLRGRKVAGILLEMQGQALTIGIGINLAATPPADTLEPAATPPISLREATGSTVTPEEFLPTLATAFQHWEAQLTTYGFEPIRTEWLNHAARLGETITARMPNRTETGTFTTIDATGAIVLQTAKGAITLPAADIFFGPEV